MWGATNVLQEQVGRQSRVQGRSMWGERMRAQTELACIYRLAC